MLRRADGRAGAANSGQAARHCRAAGPERDDVDRTSPRGSRHAVRGATTIAGSAARAASGDNLGDAGEERVIRRSCLELQFYLPNGVAARELRTLCGDDRDRTSFAAHDSVGLTSGEEALRYGDVLCFRTSGELFCGPARSEKKRLTSVGRRVYKIFCAWANRVPSMYGAVLVEYSLETPFQLAAERTEPRVPELLHLRRRCGAPRPGRRDRSTRRVRRTSGPWHVRFDVSGVQPGAAGRSIRGRNRTVHGGRTSACGN